MRSPLEEAERKAFFWNEGGGPLVYTLLAVSGVLAVSSTESAPGFIVAMVLPAVFVVLMMKRRNSQYLELLDKELSA